MELEGREVLEKLFSYTNHEVYLLSANGSPPSGFIATWVLPASLQSNNERCVVLASPLNYTTELILNSKKFVLHLLSDQQLDLLPRFGIPSGREGDKFSGARVLEDEFGPLVEGVLGYQRCELITTFDLGERILLVGEFKGGEVKAQGKPLRKKDAFSRLDAKIVEELTQKHRVMAEASLGLLRDF